MCDSVNAASPRFYTRLGDSKKDEKIRLELATNGPWGSSGEEGTTSSGKQLVSRELVRLAEEARVTLCLT